LDSINLNFWGNFFSHLWCWSSAPVSALYGQLNHPEIGLGAGLKAKNTKILDFKRRQRSLRPIGARLQIPSPPRANGPALP